ncbi:hypothetical protein [Pseudomonas sp. PLMAX]|uniref:hypothetical protein n=1 Tax=Pseudomonas sp. PLMAX TaxID=2201998 RepID=UPI0038B7F406
MDKAELSKLLEDKVQEKLQDGYTITTYAMDAASRDRLKRGLKPQANPTLHDDSAGAEWEEYLMQLEVGGYAPDSRRSIMPEPKTAEAVHTDQACSSGLWRVRRH